MKRTIEAVCLSLVAADVLVVGQAAEVQRVLAGIRQALGGEARLAAVKTVAIEGQVTRSQPDGTSGISDVELAFDLPDKFVKVDVFAHLGGTALRRRIGFNGSDAIEEVDAPAAMGGGGMHVVRMSPGGFTPGGQAAPEQVAAQRQQLLAAHRREFARLALGMFGTAFDVMPLEFTYGGHAESPDGKADVLVIKGPDGFAARLFVDASSRLPLMLSWMDREPLRMAVGNTGGGVRSADPAAFQRDFEERMKQAEARRRTVEYRLFYGDYTSFGEVKLPTRLQRMTDGLLTEEMTFDKVKINGKVDAAMFRVVK